MYLGLFENRTFNLQIADLLGLKAAVYWTALLEIAQQAIDNNLVTDGFFTLDRAYIQKNTTLDLDEQKECEVVLVSVGVAEYNKNLVRTNMKQMISYITAESKTVIEDIKKQARKNIKEAKADAKKEGINSTMKNIAKDNIDDIDIQNALCDWVDAVYARKNFLTKAIITKFKADLLAFSTEKSVLLDLLTLATQKGYKQAEYIIPEYIKTHSNSASKLNISKQQVATSVKSDIAF